MATGPQAGPPAAGVGAILAAHRDRLLDLPGVIGVGEGERGGIPCVSLLVSAPVAGVNYPCTLDGVRVTMDITGPLTV